MSCFNALSEAANLNVRMRYESDFFYFSNSIQGSRREPTMLLTTLHIYSDMHNNNLRVLLYHKNKAIENHAHCFVKAVQTKRLITTVTAFYFVFDQFLVGKSWPPVAKLYSRLYHFGRRHKKCAS